MRMLNMPRRRRSEGGGGEEEECTGAWRASEHQIGASARGWVPVGAGHATVGP